ncbi:hypothetical protein ACS0TY_010615 [Phlomoides rotata]
MNGNNELNNGGRGRKKVVQNIRGVWIYIEEMELVNALKELVVKGNKCDNDFKIGYLLLLENMLANKFPGLNSTTYRINALPEVWEAQLKHYSDTVNEMNTQTTKKHGSLCAGDQAGETPLTNEFSTAEYSSFNVGENSSATKDKRKSSKRRQVNELPI